MNAREEILSRVRSALTDVPPGPPEEDTPVPWQYGRATGVHDLLERFTDRIVDYRAQLVPVPSDGVGEAVVTALRSAGAQRVVVPPGLDETWVRAVEDGGLTVVLDDPPLSPTALDGVDAVVTASAVAMAETGTIVLDHGPDQGRRAISLVPDVHVCVVRADQVVTDVPEAVTRLHGAARDRRPITWISGGSATSDIELSRVEGVHGPRTLIVILAT